MSSGEKFLANLCAEELISENETHPDGIVVSNIFVNQIKQCEDLLEIMRILYSPIFSDFYAI